MQRWRQIFQHHTSRRLASRKRACVAAILREREELEILFIRRSINVKDKWSGQIAFPGGRQELNETDQETVERETMEEIGLDISSSSDTVYLGHLMDYKAGKDLVVGAFVYFLNSNSDQLLLRLSPDEVSDAMWIKVSYLTNTRSHRTLPYRVAQYYPWLNPIEPCLALVNLDKVALPCIYLPKGESDVEGIATERERDAQDFVLWGITLNFTLTLLQLFQLK